MLIEKIINEKYEIQREIKRGGFGIIYAGLDNHLGKTVAIKIIDPKFLGEAKYIDMFYQEAINIARLNHHNIVQVYDIHRDDDGQIYIIMEFIDGFDLMNLLRACRRKSRVVPIHLGVHIIAEVCNGLDYVHNRKDSETNQPLNLIHQDISPVNIMLARSGEVKVIDFGIAHFLHRHATNSKEVEFQGKIHYLAPEQVNNRATMDRRVDIFALGLILFEIVTGERLIKSEDSQKTLEALITGNWNLSQVYSDKVPEKIQETIRRSLEHKPENRHRSANHMFRDLMHYLISTFAAANLRDELASFIEKVEPEMLETKTDIPLKEDTNNESVELKGTSASEYNEFSETVPELSEVENPMITDVKPHALNKKDSMQSAEMDVDTEIDDKEKADFRLNEDTINEVAESIDNVVEKQTEMDYDTSSNYYSFVEDDQEDDQKTIIDVVRLSARTHKKTIIISMLTLLISILSFMVVDTFAQFTSIGSMIYNVLFPPAITIESIPSGAQVYLNDKLLNQTTPVSLDKISPGVHKLMLSLPQYESIVKSINVRGKGVVRLEGESKRHASQPYILQFKNQLEFTSQPPNADIIIDGIKIGQRTPATIFWDVTEKPTEIAMAHPGIMKLTGLRINSIDNKEYIDDRRFWSVDRIKGGRAHYKIEGVFHKNITFHSNPKLVDIFHNESTNPIGVTGLNGTLMLPLGQHTITLRKDSYLPNIFKLDVNEKTPKEISLELSRTVRIFAKDAFTEVDKDVGATLVELSSGHKTIKYDNTTPAILQLLPYTYTAKLMKDGFHDINIEILPTEKFVVVKMQPIFSIVTISASDMISNEPINAAKILYKKDQISLNEQEILGLTNSKGKLTAKFIPGFYEVIISKHGYQRQKKNFRIRTEENKQLNFRLTTIK